ncbi:SdpI family protein [Gorillibacterium massiliense]|uniref:SdpI family protein n=1 Tax=Gorillibacterium massiliense TaxID=1280390 RepID=UPI0004BC0FEE|nr:SdpI family protein [Gorillibacterium massiliense]
MTKYKWSWYDTVALLAGLAVLAYGLYQRNSLPDRVVTHFGANGPNGHMNKDGMLLLLGAISVGLPILAGPLRAIDPKRQRYAMFEGSYRIIRISILLILDFLFYQMIDYNLGKEIFAVIPSTLVLGGVMFVIIGNYMPRIKDNYFVGIKTPWTLADPEVWRRTHRMAGPIWIIGGVLMIAAAFVSPEWRQIAMIAAILLCVLAPSAYSYVLWRQKNAKQG